MTATTTTAIFVAIGYLLGSLPFAIIVSRAFGLADPRSFGSGNPGATNVLRTGNKLAAVLTLLGDAAKGWLAVWLAQRFGTDPLTSALAGLAAFIGHVFPIMLGFKGGKGVATAAGVFLGLHAGLASGVIGVWLLLAFATRYSSLAALGASVSAPLFGIWLLTDHTQMLVILVISLIVIWRHRANIEKLRAGTESRIGGSKAQAQPSDSNS